MRVPSGMAARVLRARARRVRARRAAGDDRHRGRARRDPRRDRARALRRRQGARRPPASRRRPAERLPGRHRRRRAQPDRLRRAQRRHRPDGGGRQAGRGDARRHQAEGRQAARPAVQRDDPGRGRGRDRHRPRRDHGARPTSWRAGTPLAEVLPIATDVLVLEITPNRPDCLGVYGVAREVHAATGAPLQPPPWADDPGSAGRASTPRRVDRRVPRSVPALHRARVRGRQDRRVAAVAQGAADGRRPAADLQRRRHHQLRDAAHRPADARLRPRPRRRRAADRAPRAATARRSRRSTARRARWTPRWC